MGYAEFLESKRIAAKPSGFEPRDLNPNMKPHQHDITEWACRQGRGGVWADTGLGKTLIELGFGERIYNQLGGNTLILCPLAVAKQTSRESVKFGIQAPVKVVRHQSEVEPGISITNYQMLKHFDLSKFMGCVVDESDILANFSGVTKKAILEATRDTPYKLDCSATPAPNDHMEIGNHADFLSVMGSNEMLARWFINDAGEAGKYRLKEHGKADFWRWVASWAVAITKPSDLGYPNEAYDLPPLIFHDRIAEVDITSNCEPGFLLRMPSLSATGMHKEMRRTIKNRAEEVRKIIESIPGDEPILIWCHTDYEADCMKGFPGIVEVRGSQKLEEKENRLEAFQLGQIRILLSKPGIAGHGLNFQHCRNVIYVGLDYSFKGFYQSIRRCWRFGQTKPVNVYVVQAETEGKFQETIQRKQRDYDLMKRSMVEAMIQFGLGAERTHQRLKSYAPNVPMEIPSWLKSHRESDHEIAAS